MEIYRIVLWIGELEPGLGYLDITIRIWALGPRLDHLGLQLLVLIVLDVMDLKLNTQM